MDGRMRYLDRMENLSDYCLKKFDFRIHVLKFTVSLSEKNEMIQRPLITPYYPLLFEEK